jgi:hypothetical protein
MEGLEFEAKYITSAMRVLGKYCEVYEYELDVQLSRDA